MFVRRTDDIGPEAPGHQAKRPWMRRSGNSRGARSCRLHASLRGKSSPVTERSCDPSGQRRAEKKLLCDLRLTARFESWWSVRRVEICSYVVTRTAALSRSKNT